MGAGWKPAPPRIPARCELRGWTTIRAHRDVGAGLAILAGRAGAPCDSDPTRRNRSSWTAGPAHGPPPSRRSPSSPMQNSGGNPMITTAQTSQPGLATIVRPASGNPGLARGSPPMSCPRRPALHRGPRTKGRRARQRAASFASSGRSRGAHLAGQVSRPPRAAGSGALGLRHTLATGRPRRGQPDPFARYALGIVSGRERENDGGSSRAKVEGGRATAGSAARSPHRNRSHQGL
jgi:hypothetical protein